MFLEWFPVEVKHLYLLGDKFCTCPSGTKVPKECFQACSKDIENKDVIEVHACEERCICLPSYVERECEKSIYFNSSLYKPKAFDNYALYHYYHW